MKRTTGNILAVGLTFAALAALAPLPAAAQESGRWLMSRFVSHGVDEGVSEVFANLLKADIVGYRKVRFLRNPGTEPCGDADCAQALGEEHGAVAVVYGSITALGTKIIVNVGVLDLKGGGTPDTEKMAVDRVEDLDLVAQRIGRALAVEKSAEETAELGNITHKEVEPARRREGDRGLAFRMGGLVPIGEGYAKGESGVLLDLSYWFETNDFAIEPRVGVRFDTPKESGNDDGYLEVPIDVGVFYVFSRGDFAPFAGGGAGVRYMKEKMTIEEKTEAPLLEETSTTTVDNSGWGFGAFGRVGILMLRTYAVRVALAVDYNISLLEQEYTSTPQSITFGVNVMF